MLACSGLKVTETPKGKHLQMIAAKAPSQRCLDPTAKSPDKRIAIASRARTQPQHRSMQMLQMYCYCIDQLLCCLERSTFGWLGCSSTSLLGSSCSIRYGGSPLCCEAVAITLPRTIYDRNFKRKTTCLHWVVQWMRNAKLFAA